MDCDGFVKLINMMGCDADVASAARVSTASEGKDDVRLIEYLAAHKHTTPFRHCQLKYHIKAPIFVMRQWMRHTVGCVWSEMSGRYIDASNQDVYYPRKFRKAVPGVKQGSGDTLGEIDNAYVLSVYSETLMKAKETYEFLLKEGVCKEQARMILPQALYTEAYWTCSLHALTHFVKLRTDSHAQLEIQRYAKEVERLARQFFPISIDALLRNS